MQPSADTGLAVQVVLKEFEFVSSLIPMYRGMQMQVLRYAMTLYVGSLGLIGATLASSAAQDVRVFVAALIPWPAGVLIWTFCVAEIRMQRASLYIRDTIQPQIRRLIGFEVKPLGLLAWESDPAVHLSSVQRKLAASWALVLVIGLPAIAGPVWLLLGMQTPLAPAVAASATVGAVVLVASMGLASAFSLRHEGRRARSQEPGHSPPSRARTGETAASSSTPSNVG